MKKQIKDFPNYYIYDDGTVINITNGKVLNGSIGENGYKYFRLANQGRKKMFYAHRLVAENFIENTENLPVVNHKDGNKLNNNIENLEWVSYSDNAKHFHQEIKKDSKNKKTEYYTEDLNGEIWIAAKNNSNYLVSNYGRIRHKIKNNLLRPVETSGYYKVRLSQNSQTEDWLVHKLVFMSFYNEENDNNYCIDHIDGNKHNNHLDNLRKITFSENVKNAYYIQKTNSNIKPINQYDLNGVFLATFPSSREAGRQLNLDSSSITKCCKGRVKTVGGFIFHYA